MKDKSKHHCALDEPSLEQRVCSDSHNWSHIPSTGDSYGGQANAGIAQKFIQVKYSGFHFISQKYNYLLSSKALYKAHLEV